MTTKYIIESKLTHTLYSILDKLKDAKYDLKKMYKPGYAAITCLKFPNLYNKGYRLYSIIYDGKRFIKTKIHGKPVYTLNH